MDRTQGDDRLSLATALVEYPNNSREIGPDQAKQLFNEHCAFLVVEALPTGTEFGLDLNLYRIGEKFKGVKLIPPGIHFIYANSLEQRKSSPSSESRQQSGPRCGFYHDFQPGEVLIIRWSSDEEEFDMNFKPDENYRERYAKNLHDLDKFLGCYSFETYEAFKRLTSKFKPRYINSLIPEANLIRAIPYLISADNDELSRSKRIKRSTLAGYAKSNEENLLPSLKPDGRTVINFTKIPKDHLDSKTVIANDLITQYNLDSTWKLEQTFSEDKDRLLAEFQFAFVTFILCHVYDCFEQWKEILSLICKSDSGLKKYTEFFQEFVETLESQFDQIPEDLFADLLDEDNMIRHLLDTFFQNVRAEFDHEESFSPIKSQIERFRNQIEAKFQWQFDLELLDEQPVIVDN